jgi:hypothetical protein
MPPGAGRDLRQQVRVKKTLEEGMLRCNTQNAWTRRKRGIADVCVADFFQSDKNVVQDLALFAREKRTRFDDRGTSRVLVAE